MQERKASFTKTGQSRSYRRETKRQREVKEERMSATRDEKRRSAERSRLPEKECRDGGSEGTSE